MLLLLVLGAALAVALPAISAGASAVAPQHRHKHHHKSHHPEATTKPADGLGVKPGAVKHVWLIILENKSYDASFTGLNKNTYLWQSLPKQGALLRNYYGTGHFSLDNYISLVSGQATQPDTQADCPSYDSFGGHVDMSGTLRSNPNYGQMTSAAGPNGAPGSNGCVYPSDVPTLFNQLDSAHKSWKGYAQDLGNADATGSPHDAGTRYCGAPYATPGPTASKTQANPGAANATDQYVPKHFPFPWFESILGSGDCNASHIANVFDSSAGLYRDLQQESTTPAFSWISPNNCSDGHDAVCAGNNLSGGFSGATTPNAPVNYTGGLYAADLFLEHVIPEIEASPAFKHGGLIDITFDEGFPPFTYTGNSFANSTIVAPNAQTSVQTDSAAETLFGKPVHTEPTGPNTPLATTGQALYPGPGYNSFVDRPANCVAQTVPSQPTGTCLLGGGNQSPGARADAGATAAAGSSTIADNSILATDTGRAVTGTGIPSGAYVGAVTNTPTTATAPSSMGGFVDTGSFHLVDSSGQPVDSTAGVTGIMLAARTSQTDPLYDYADATTGGGDTGSVLISPYIKPGTVSTGYYNHYSWLRTIEDLFNVSSASQGLDGQGHIGYAAQPGLAPFGSDVFTDPSGIHPTTPAHKHRHRHKRGHASWLPQATVPQDRAMNASAAHPALAIQGNTVDVHLAGGHVLATALGPTVPITGGFPVPATRPCTFVLTLSRATTTVPLRAGAFVLVDGHHHAHHPTVTTLGGGPPPPALRPGQTLSLKLQDVLPTGDGGLQFSPTGSRPLVAWDYTVEVD